MQPPLKEENSDFSLQVPRFSGHNHAASISSPFTETTHQIQPVEYKVADNFTDGIPIRTVLVLSVSSNMYEN